MHERIAHRPGDLAEQGMVGIKGIKGIKGIEGIEGHRAPLSLRSLRSLEIPSAHGAFSLRPSASSAIISGIASIP